MTDGRVAMMTGGGSGIGRAICRVPAADGRRVAIADLTDAGAAEPVDLVTDDGGIAHATHVDVTDTDSVVAVSYLSSDAAGFVTGRTRSVSDGLTMA